MIQPKNDYQLKEQPNEFYSNNNKLILEKIKNCKYTEKYLQKNNQTDQKTLNNELTKLEQFLQYLQKQYPPGSKRFNLGSVYQIPIQNQGLQLLIDYCYWNIQFLNLTMHKIDNQGLLTLIKNKLIKQNNSKNEDITTEQQIQQNKYDQKWTQLKQLSLIRNLNLTSDGFNDIQKAQIPNFQVLRASSIKLDHTAIYKFIQCQWPNFKQLHIAGSRIGKQGCKLLMKSKWKHFQRLDLNTNNIGNIGMHYLTQADWPQLIQINLTGNRLDAQATFYIRQANWPQLKQLFLNKNQIGLYKGRITQIGCLNLCNIKSSSLKRLFLYSNQITLNAIQIIIKSSNFQSECFLELSRNHFYFEDIKDLLKQNKKFCNEFDYYT